MAYRLWFPRQSSDTADASSQSFYTLCAWLRLLLSLRRSELNRLKTPVLAKQFSTYTIVTVPQYLSHTVRNCAGDIRMKGAVEMRASGEIP